MHVTAGQLALALTPYAQVTDLAVNTAASGNNAAAIQSLDDRVTAACALAAIAPLATAAALATTDGQGVSARDLQESVGHLGVDLQRRDPRRYVQGVLAHHRLEAVVGRHRGQRGVVG